ncbi:DUF397 domain-containing protein [Saccharopolyspora cebuensis]|uniref:DUF397 domain-containing protein n=1 Tax=Saccharopolyspora cebuensis TaxID=418759 RepID=A0ABV4CNX1_9PSEU
MPSPDLSRVLWRTSSRSTDHGNCVEVGAASGFAAVRDTKDRDGGTLITSPARFADFITAVKADRFR